MSGSSCSIVSEGKDGFHAVDASRSVGVHFLKASCMIQVGLRWLMIATVLVITNGLPKSHAESPSAQEYQIKAAFLYNFAKFIEWPQAAFAPNDAGLNLCLLGEDPFGAALKSIRGKTVRGKELVIKQFAAAENLEKCHILFISVSEKKRLPQIFNALKNSPVLTVGDMAQFAQAGGIINFIIVENKVRFEINVGAAQQANLKISSDLLRLARIVKDRRPEE